MRHPNRKNIIPIEVGTEARQNVGKNPSIRKGVSDVLRRFHEALEARDRFVKEEEEKAEKAKREGKKPEPFLKPSRKSTRKSLGVTYATNSVVDGVMMFWNPEVFDPPTCVLFSQFGFRFTYPPYICLFQNAVR
jgi:hypothetical protein